MLSSAALQGQTGEVAVVVLALAVMLGMAKLGADLASRAGQPPVLGELLAGVVLGNLYLLGIPGFAAIKSNLSIEVLAQLGVLILLFEVGLESTVRDMLQVGASSFLVAVLGVITPFALGWGVGKLMLPEHSAYAHAFLGATLTATSVGITARVLGDLGRSATSEARIILGAAVLDDVLGLLILAVVSGVLQAADLGQPPDYGGVMFIVAKAILFLVGALVLGVAVAPHLFRLASRLQGRGVLLGTALVFCFIMSYLSSAVGLALIVGAYAAGLILEDVHWRSFTDRGEHRLEELVGPVASVLVPIFFVFMGMRVDLAAFARTEILALAGLLTLAAIIGKQVCAWGALERGLDRLSIGVGMIPRGEVGLIFAGIGLTLTVRGERIVDEAMFSAIVIMVIVTTMVTPPALKWSLARREAQTAARNAT